jgi:plasmid stabilization system protein ParE
LRCREFLAEKTPVAAERAGQVIASRLLALETTPDMGRPFDPETNLRELPISFGASGYVALYRHEPSSDAVYLLAFRHQREAGYE